jgi:hypothetical protein
MQNTARYSTSVEALLENDKSMLAKMEAARQERMISERENERRNERGKGMSEGSDENE